MGAARAHPLVHRPRQVQKGQAVHERPVQDRQVAEGEAGVAEPGKYRNFVDIPDATGIRLVIKKDSRVEGTAIALVTAVLSRLLALAAAVIMGLARLLFAVASVLDSFSPPPIGFHNNLKIFI